MPRASVPLGSHGVLRTTNVDDARASIADSLAPHQLLPIRHAGFMAQHNAADLGEMSFHYIDYGTEVEVLADRLDFHLIQIPLAGLTTIRYNDQALQARPGDAVVTPPDVPVRMRYSAGNPRLMVRISTDFLAERVDLAASGGLVARQLTGTGFAVSSGSGRSWRDLVEMVMTDLERDNGLASASFAKRSLQLAVADGLIVSLAEQQKQERAPDSAPERVIRRAAALIEEHCAEPIGTPDIAEAVGLSIRALQAGFKLHLGTTPMAYVRYARLLGVRRSLSDGSAATVTDAATQWGVSHLGRLAGDYRAAFGETPSETLQRAR